MSAVRNGEQTVFYILIKNVKLRTVGGDNRRGSPHVQLPFCHIVVNCRVMGSIQYLNNINIVLT